jgi:hypothetical protein
MDLATEQGVMIWTHWKDDGVTFDHSKEMNTKSMSSFFQLGCMYPLTPSDQGYWCRKRTIEVFVLHSSVL